MAQDPYGFREAPAKAASPTRTSGAAAQTMWLGVGALVVCAVAPCLGQVPHFVSLPLGAWAVWQGMQASSGLAGDADGRAMNTAGMVAGGVATAISGLMATFLLLYAAFLFAMIAFGLMAGNN